jgi:hypothetical protein
VKGALQAEVKREATGPEEQFDKAFPKKAEQDHLINL